MLTLHLQFAQMEGEKWKELNKDCLVNVLGRVGIESLLIDVPFVCKSWYKAMRSPLCWRKLDFLEILIFLKSHLMIALLYFS
ncbi:hypothetical protein ACSBR1_031186 [Camellia fascicularis]